jgi:hypothetical protein
VSKGEGRQPHPSAGQRRRQVTGRAASPHALGVPTIVTLCSVPATSCAIVSEGEGIGIGCWMATSDADSEQ